MSEKEVERLTKIQQVIAKQISQVEASRQLHLTTRQVRNLQCRYENDGLAGLISKRRGRPSNHRLSESLKVKTVELIQGSYGDFGPTLAHEKLSEQHGLKLSVESVRQLMMKAGLWKGKQARQACIDQSRQRRSQRGEWVQIDGSPHDWFEERGPRCCLLVFIDDATSELLVLHFVEQECTEGYFSAVEKHLQTHGRPLAYYSDRHGIFRVNIKEAQSGSGETQMGRALRELDIELICANSPQAKGRVEKANRTLQDRLVKEMRLRGISDIHTGNAFLPEFMADYNRRFAVEASHLTDAHRPNHVDEIALGRILNKQCQRMASKNLEISYDNIIYKIQVPMPSYALRSAQITICDNHGKITLRYKGRTLPYKTIDKHNRPTSIQDRKTIWQSTSRKVHKPKSNHSWRQYERTPPFKDQRATAI